MAAKKGAERRSSRPRKIARQDAIDRAAFRLGWRSMEMLQRYDGFVGWLEQACENPNYWDGPPGCEGRVQRTPFRLYPPTRLACDELEEADGRRKLAEALAKLRMAAAALNARCESLENDPNLQRALGRGHTPDGDTPDGDTPDGVAAADAREWLAAGTDVELRGVADAIFKLIELMQEPARAHFQFGLVLSRLELPAPVLERALTFELADGQSLLTVFPELRRFAEPLATLMPDASAEDYERADRDRCEEAVIAAASRLHWVHREMPMVRQFLNAVRGTDELGRQRWDSVALLDAERLLWPTPTRDYRRKILDSERELGVELVDGEYCLVYRRLGLLLNRNMRIVAELLVNAGEEGVSLRELKAALGSSTRNTSDLALKHLRDGIKAVFKNLLDLKNRKSENWYLVKRGGTCAPAIQEGDVH
jgi:hypothetical protein